MFCGNCGAQNADNSAFCKNCGAQLNAAPQQQPQQPVYQPQYNAAPKKPLNKKLIGMIAGGAAAVVLVVVLLIVLLGGGAGAGSPEAVAEKYVKAMGNIDTNAILDLVPEAAYDYLAEDQGYDDIDEMREDMNAGAEEAEEMLDMLNMKISGEAVDTEKLKGDDLEDLQEAYDDEFNVEVTAAAAVEVEVTMSASYMGETMEESDDMTVYVVEIDGTWYIDVFNFDISDMDLPF